MTGLERVSFFRLRGEQHLDLPEDSVAVCRRGHGKPGLLRVDHHVGSLSAESHAATAGDTHAAPPAPFLDLVLEVILEGCVAAAVGAGLLLSVAVVGADKHMATVGARLFLHASIPSFLMLSWSSFDSAYRDSDGRMKLGRQKLFPF